MTTRLRLAVLASGRGSNLAAILDAASTGRLDMEVAVVISDQPQAAALEHGRRADIPSEVLEFDGHPDTYGRRLTRLCESYEVDVVALAGFMRIIPAGFLEAFPGEVFNIHPSLLPAFPGLNAQRQALEYGVRISGCTVHFVDAGVDTGPIILQVPVPVYTDDDEETLSARILEWEHRLYPRALQLYAEGRLKKHGRRVKIDCE